MRPAPGARAPRRPGLGLTAQRFDPPPPPPRQAGWVTGDWRAYRPARAPGPRRWREPWRARAPACRRCASFASHTARVGAAHRLWASTSSAASVRVRRARRLRRSLPCRLRFHTRCRDGSEAGCSAIATQLGGAHDRVSCRAAQRIGGDVGTASEANHRLQRRPAQQMHAASGAQDAGAQAGRDLRAARPRMPLLAPGSSSSATRTPRDRRRAARARPRAAGAFGEDNSGVAAPIRVRSHRSVARRRVTRGVPV